MFGCALLEITVVVQQTKGSSTLYTKGQVGVCDMHNTSGSSSNEVAIRQLVKPTVVVIAGSSARRREKDALVLRDSRGHGRFTSQLRLCLMLLVIAVDAIMAAPMLETLVDCCSGPYAAVDCTSGTEYKGQVSYVEELLQCVCVFVCVSVQ